MKSRLKYLYKLLLTFGFDPIKTIHAIQGLPYYFRNRTKFKQQGKQSAVIFPMQQSLPCLADRFEVSGIANGHYFHQDLFVARQIFQHAPAKHIDVGSRVDGFVAHVAVFRKIEVFDIRQLDNKIENIHFTQLDFMQPLPQQFHNYCHSVSCLHALEHFGLGRYGDPIDFEGYLKGFNNLYTLLKAQGRLYLSVPIGPLSIEFDAHRIFSVHYLLELIRDKFTLETFAYVDNQGDLHTNVTLTPETINNSFGCQYGCGILTLTKKAA